VIQYKPSSEEKSEMKKALIIFGTRPEAIKLSMVIRELHRHKDLSTFVAVTAQHREMLDQVMTNFKIVADYDLNIMLPDQDLFGLSARAIGRLGSVLKEVRPDIVIVQGDTTSTFVGSLAAYYLKIPVAHVEAGLRTNDPYSPFPEEMNRRLTGAIASLHFPPTAGAKDNLVREGVPEDRIFLTGNTGIDALLWTISNTSPTIDVFQGDKRSNKLDGRFLLVTVHRRESFGEPMTNIMRAISTIAERFQEISIIFPVHLNPNVRRQAYSHLKNVANIRLIDPVDYKNFAHLMNRAYFILTDSGGIQEEAPSLGKPVLVLRDVTERPEGIKIGAAKLVGTNQNLIFSEAERLLCDRTYYESMAKCVNPYGDGKASMRIGKTVRQFLNLDRSRQ
jgi:UDP-N-acetylglucosamine 2-epimerase (non-hydrolysing)